MVLAQENYVLEILKRAKGFQSGEGISFLESESNVREEVNRRTCKAGYTTKHGEPRGATKIMTTSNWGERKLNIWPRDKNGNLIE